MANENNGALFANDKREKDTHPTHTGSATIDGKDYWVSAWVKEKNGRKYFSMAFKLKEQQNQHAAGFANEPPPAGADFEDDIPFNRVINCHAL